MSNTRVQQQDPAEVLKNFFRVYGKYVIAFFVVIFVLYIGSTIYTSHQNTKNLESASVYQKFSQAVTAKNTNTMAQIVSSLQQNYKSSPYTAMASIQLAKSLYSNNDYVAAATNLNWVIINAQSANYVDMAKLDLAKVYIQQGNMNAAHDILLSAHSAAFDVPYLEEQGDMYVVQGDTQKAISAYKEALSKSQGDEQASQLLDFKLGVIGG